MGVRKFKVAGVQIGGIQRSTPKSETVERLVKLLHEAADNGAKLAVFPELTLTSFFPRWLIEDEAEIDSFFEKGDISKGEVKPLFEAAIARDCGFVLGYAELTDDGHRFNSCILVDNKGQVVQKYRKAHLPGYVEPTPGIKWQQLEKRYFEYGDVGFPAFRTNPEFIDGIFGMLICNDRRWPEAWRVYALQGMEMCFNGYNTTADGTALFNKVENKEVRLYHSDLSTKSNAYCNSCFAVSVAKCGVEDDQELIAGSLIVDPNGLVLAQAKTEGDEIIYADIDLDETISGKQRMFDFSRHRRPELYDRLVSQKGATPIPPLE